jgi:hypothetical protein
MLPDLSRLEYNQPLRGLAFTVHARSQGIGVQDLQMEVDPAGWEKCLGCPDYRTCYDLSMAKLVLYRALRDTI